MKLFSILILSAMPLISLAAPPPTNIDPAKMQKLMQEMQACMQNVDMSEMEKLKTRGKAMEKEVRSLCDQGQRDAAMDKAVAYSKEMMNAPGLVQIKKCSENASTMIPNMADIEKFSADKFKNMHVCDSMK